MTAKATNESSWQQDVIDGDYDIHGLEKLVGLKQ